MGEEKPEEGTATLPAHFTVGYETTRELGIFIIKTLITINSGGAVVLLTFIGTAKDQSLFKLDAESLRNAMIAFMCGVVLAMLMALLAYVRNYMITTSMLDVPSSFRSMVPYLIFLTFALGCFVIGVTMVAASFEVAQQLEASCIR